MLFKQRANGGAQPPPGDTTRPSIKDATHNHDRHL